ncbi:hypothetical protein B0H14DRAFT_699111 [Mycena olivaceomarginata]|nr:hypothetical protein B0H14DRAFT_699111 [Mycena olivaceomarginata]
MRQREERLVTSRSWRYTYLWITVRQIPVSSRVGVPLLSLAKHFSPTWPLTTLLLVPVLLAGPAAGATSRLRNCSPLRRLHPNQRCSSSSSLWPLLPTSASSLSRCPLSHVPLHDIDPCWRCPRSSQLPIDSSSSSVLLFAIPSAPHCTMERQRRTWPLPSLAAALVLSTRRHLRLAADSSRLTMTAI